MASLTVVTNNRRVAEKFGEKFDGAVFADFVDGDPIDVLARVVALLQENRRLISAPLPPNVPMMRAPFRSLLLETSASKYDIAGIEATERARKAMAKQRAIAGETFFAEGSEESDDFARIDEASLDRAMRDYALIRE